MRQTNPFKSRPFEGEIILLCALVPVLYALRGHEIMHMSPNGQLRGADRRDNVSQNHLSAEVFGLA